MSTILRFVILLSVIVLASVLGISISSAAQGQTQAAMNATAYKDYKKSDDKLNLAYKQLKTALLDEKQKKLLTVAQLAWLKFRDAEAEFLASDSKGGSIWPTIYAGSLATLTEQRTKALEDSYNGQTHAELPTSSAISDYKKADDKLNVAYKQLKTAPLDEKQKKLLTTAQLAWLKFRDAESEFLSSNNNAGNVAVGFSERVHKAFLTRLTAQRTKELESSYKYFK